MRIKDFLKLFASSLAAGLPAVLSLQAQAGQINAPILDSGDTDQGRVPLLFHDTLNNTAENLYAAHHSHSSHASHASHSSHYSSSGGGSYYTPPPAPTPAPAPAPNITPPRATPQLLYDKEGNAFICTPQDSGPPDCKPVSQKQDYQQEQHEPRLFESGNDLEGVDPSALARVVMRVQISLRLKGFYEGPITEQLRQDTRDALRQFQISQGLDQEGYLNTQTLDALGVRIG